MLVNGAGSTRNRTGENVVHFVSLSITVHQVKYKISAILKIISLTQQVEALKQRIGRCDTFRKIN